MLLMQLKGVNNEQILCTVQYTVLFSKYIVLHRTAAMFISADAYLWQSQVFKSDHIDPLCTVKYNIFG